MLTHVPGYNVTTDSIRSKTVKDSYVKWDAGLLINALTTTNSSLTLDNAHDSFYINNANAATISVTILNTINDYTANSNTSIRRINVIIDSRSAANDRTVTFTIPNTFTLIGGLPATRNLYHGNLQVFVVEIVNNTVNIYDGVGSYFEVDSNGDLMPLNSSADLVPRTDLSGQLGTGDKRWAAVYAGNITNTYDSVADMVSDTSLKEGGTAFTKGYYTVNDGGNAFYIIREKEVSDVDDAGSIIFLDNGNVAELIAPQDNFWNVMLYGIRSNTGDNYLRIHTMIKNTVYKTGGTLYFPKGKYTTSYTLFIPENTTLTGDGADSEIYFDETDTAFGVCIANAGSNVTIRDIKISQRSKGIFHSGPQPGCIGIGGMAKEQAIEAPYSHTFHYAEVQNLIVENVWFDGFYPLQCEPGDYSVHNVVYRNLYCPDGCVSMESNTGEVNNITVDNVVCDLFRIKANRTDIGKYCNNVNVSNVTCNTLYINGANQEKKCCTIKNLVMTKNTRKNDVLDSYSVWLRGNIFFENCYFTSIDTETSGINKGYSVQEFKNCIFDFAAQLLVNNASSDTDYIIAENCSFKCPATGVTGTYLIGYGKNNKYEGNAACYLWGDIHNYYYAMDKNTSAETHQNNLYINGEQVRLSIYSYGDNGTMFVAHNRLKHLPWTAPIPILLWNLSNRVGTSIHTYGTIDSNGLISVTEPGVNIASYNRALIDCDMVLSRIPTPMEVYKTIQGAA